MGMARKKWVSWSASVDGDGLEEVGREELPLACAGDLIGLDGPPRLTDRFTEGRTVFLIDREAEDLLGGGAPALGARLARVVVIIG